MASDLYDSGAQAHATGFDWTDALITVNAYLVDGADYTFDPAHAVLADLPTIARVSSFAVTGRTAVAGVCDAADGTFPAVTGDPSEIVVLHDATNDVLIAYLDGVSVTPNGGDVDVQWDNGADKVYAI